ncbi:MAG: pyridoxal phosphate-dependent aminotransferase, partial [Proteobacteria bacterium]|nr:pyridoxal phosphate-dependent aminotransferase [Pseudomonadota bacterium]
MSLSVSKRMAAVRPSPTGAVLALVTELRAAGRDIISLGAGEPDFDTPQHIKDAAQRAIEDGVTKYTPIDGTAELKRAVQQKFSSDNQLDYEISQIIVSSGAKQCLFNLCLGLLGPGDEVIIPAPYWVSYPDMVRLAGAEPVLVAASIEQDFKITPRQLAAAITDTTRLLILNSPSNPTGASYSKAELEALGATLIDHPNIVIVADDIYEHIHWGTDPFVSFAAACPDLFDRTVTTNGVSKAYAMTGWRIGYAAGPAELIAAMKTIQSQCTSNPCSVSQVAALAALSGDQSAVREMTAAYKERHDYVVAALNDIDGFECRR